MYPLVYCRGWNHDKLVDAVTGIAISLGFVLKESLSDVHETDPQRIIDEFVRDHKFSNRQAVKRLSQQRSLLRDRYRRSEHRWSGNVGEIVLVLADDNEIPFPDIDIETTGEIRFACGWVEFVFTDRDCDNISVFEAVRDLPLLYDRR